MYDPNNPIRNPKLNDLANPQTAAAHLLYMKDSITREQTYESLLSSKFVRDWLREHATAVAANPQLYQPLQQVMLDCTWIALPMINQSDIVVNLFHEHVNDLFSIPQRYQFDYPTDDFAERTLTEGVRSYLLNYMLFQDRDAIKKQLIAALETNQEVLTSAPLYEQIKQIPSTLQNWFTLYKLYMGSAIESSAQRYKFLHISENGAALSEVDRQKLGLILQLHYRLKQSSSTPYGMEEEIYYEDGEESGIFLYGEKHPHDKNVVKTVQELLQANNPAGITARPPVPRVGTTRVRDAIVTGPNVDATKGPDHFTEQDEAEVQQHSGDAQLFAKLARVNKDPAKTVAELKQLLHLTFGSPQEEKRFTDLLVSVLRGLRDSMEFRQYIVDLGYPAAQVEAITAAVKAVLQGKKPTAVATSAVRSAVAAQPTLQQVASKISTMGAAGTNTAPTDVPAPHETVEPVAAVTPTKSKSFLPKLRRSRLSKKPLIDDVKLQPSMMMGPIDELHALDALEFRRLSPHSTQSAARIKDKIDLLAEESVAKQAEGIQAFKASPLNALYLELGNQSIATGQTVTDLIASLQARGTPTLSVDEFNAIADLNKQLRF